MKKALVGFVVFCIICFVPLLVMAGPRVVIEEPVYAFESVIEGEHVYHEFVLKNSGDTLLNIIKVLPP